MKEDLNVEFFFFIFKDKFFWVFCFRDSLIRDFFFLVGKISYVFLIRYLKWFNVILRNKIRVSFIFSDE